MSVRAKRIWDRMMEIYGMRWVNSYGAEPTELWVELAESLEDYQIRHAIRTFAHSLDSFVPTLGQFKATARDASLPPDLHAKRVTQDHSRWDRETCEANVRKLGDITRRALRGDFSGLSAAQIEREIFSHD